MNKDETLTGYFDRGHNIYLDLDSLGIKIPEILFCRRVLCGLHQTHSQLAGLLIQKPDNELTINEIRGAFEVETGRCLASNRNPSGGFNAPCT